MTAEEILAQMATVAGPNTLMTLSPGPMTLAVGPTDAQAAELIRHLDAAYPDMTTGEALDLLDAARWWIQFFAAAPRGFQPTKGEPCNP
jgi:hypothetical protein